MGRKQASFRRCTPVALETHNTELGGLQTVYQQDLECTFHLTKGMVEGEFYSPDGELIVDLKDMRLFLPLGVLLAVPFLALMFQKALQTGIAKWLYKAFVCWCSRTHLRQRTVAAGRLRDLSAVQLSIRISDLDIVWHRR